MATETQETIVDIIAEKRRLAEQIRNNLSTVPVRQWDQQAEIKSLEDEADHLDRARMKMEIEMANLRKENAKLRVALCEMLNAAFVVILRHSNATEEMGRLALCVDNARAALAAPARNCDLARDWMRDLYAHFQPPASIKREMPPEWVDSVMAFCRWLVAPATEKEGGKE